MTPWSTCRRKDRHAFLAPGRLSSGQRRKMSHCRHGERPSTPSSLEGLALQLQSMVGDSPPQAVPSFQVCLACRVIPRSSSCLFQDNLHPEAKITAQAFQPDSEQVGCDASKLFKEEKGSWSSRCHFPESDCVPTLPHSGMDP